MFPYGDLGWEVNALPLVKKKQANESVIAISTEETEDSEREIITKFVTPMLYYAYRLMDRENSYLQKYGRLFHQYIVDMYAKIETQRLNYHRFNLQSKIRTELISGIQDAISNADSDARQIGKRIYLSPSFNGGPRAMMRLYQNAMSLVRELGLHYKLYYFFTIY